MEKQPSKVLYTLFRIEKNELDNSDKKYAIIKWTQKRNLKVKKEKREKIIIIKDKEGDSLEKIKIVIINQIVTIEKETKIAIKIKEEKIRDIKILSWTKSKT